MGAKAVGPAGSGLVEAFRVSQEAPALQKYRRRKWGKAREFAVWLGESALPDLSAEQAVSLYLASGGTRRQEFQGNRLDEIRDSLDFLLFDNIRLEERFQECAAETGGYNLAGAGKEFVSYILCVAQPTLFAVWNSNAEQALRKLGVNTKALKRGPMGIGYMDLLESLDVVRRDFGLPDFKSVDEFAYSITRPATLRPAQGERSRTSSEPGSERGL